MVESKDLLASVSDVTTETEYFSPVPKGYKKGKARYVIVMGTVMSGLGKGIFSSSLAKLLLDKGLKVAPIKLEGYLNIDSGTLNPFRHGEVFVLDDGMECDMDLGTYERMLDQNLSRANFTTSGQVYQSVLDKERHGDYLGRDEGLGSCCFVGLTYILEPKTLGEQKSKAAQLGIKQMMQMGVQPDIIACRAENPVGEQARQKISVFSNVPFERVFSMHDSEYLYDSCDAARLRAGF